jgi:hypothetical protein
MENELYNAILNKGHEIRQMKKDKKRDEVGVEVLEIIKLTTEYKAFKKKGYLWFPIS